MNDYRKYMMSGIILCILLGITVGWIAGLIVGFSVVVIIYYIWYDILKSVWRFEANMTFELRDNRDLPEILRILGANEDEITNFYISISKNKDNDGSVYQIFNHKSDKYKNFSRIKFRYHNKKWTVLHGYDIIVNFGVAYRNLCILLPLSISKLKHTHMAIYGNNNHFIIGSCNGEGIVKEDGWIKEGFEQDLVNRLQSSSLVKVNLLDAYFLQKSHEEYVSSVDANFWSKIASKRLKKVSYDLTSGSPSQGYSICCNEGVELDLNFE